MQHKTFREWARTSLIGHVVIFEMTFSLALLILFLIVNYNEGTLTLAWALHLVFISTVAGAVLAITIWYAFSAKYSKRGGSSLD